MHDLTLYPPPNLDITKATLSAPLLLKRGILVGLIVDLQFNLILGDNSPWDIGLLAKGLWLCDGGLETLVGKGIDLLCHRPPLLWLYSQTCQEEVMNTSTSSVLKEEAFYAFSPFWQKK